MMEKPFVFTFSAMTTRCELQCYGLPRHKADLLANRIVQRVEALVRKYNFHAPDSWLNRAVNQRTQPNIALDLECARVLRIVREHAAQVGGVFDITVGTVAAALKSATSLQHAQQIRAELEPYMGLQHWELHGTILRFDNPYTRLDLGGVIKEFGVDECLALARQAGASAALVNFGGDLNCFGRKPDGHRFVAAVQHPLQPAKPIFGLDLENQALTTSGHYARKRSLSDGELSHVIHPVTATPATTTGTWLSATVVSASTLVSGIYSTSLLLKPDLALPEQVFAVVVDAQGRVHSLPAEPPAADPATPHLPRTLSSESNSTGEIPCN